MNLTSQSTSCTLVANAIGKRFSSGRSNGQREVFRLRDMNVSLRVGESLGIVGRTGAGKSTIGRLLAGLLTPDQGTVTVNDRAVIPGDPKDWRQARSIIKYVDQDPYAILNPAMTLGALFREAFACAGVKRRDQQDEVLRLFAKYGLSPGWLDRRVGQLSSGQQRRASLVLNLVPVPQYLVLDEPFAGLDGPVREQYMGLLEELSREDQLSMIVISHDLDSVLKLVSRVIVLKDGCVAEVASYSTSDRWRFYHPYSKALFGQRPAGAHGIGAENGHDNSGCRFISECFVYQRHKHHACTSDHPELEPPEGQLYSDAAVACHFRSESITV